MAGGRVTAAITLFLALTGSAVHAGELQVNGGPCDAVVRVIAHDVSRSEVLKELSRRLAFEISYEAINDVPVNIRTARKTSDVLRQVAESMNFSIAIEPDSKCAGRLRVTRMSVLSSSQTSAAQPTAAQPRARVKDDRDEAIAAHLVAHGYLAPESAPSSR